jgi:hypothetical protein
MCITFFFYRRVKHNFFLTTSCAHYFFCTVELYTWLMQMKKLLNKEKKEKKCGPHVRNATPCGLPDRIAHSARPIVELILRQYFSRTTNQNQPSDTNQSVVYFSHNKSNHSPITEQAVLVVVVTSFPNLHRMTCKESNSLKFYGVYYLLKHKLEHTIYMRNQD